MVICFEISERTKKELDQLLDSGDFSDYSEVVTVAVANQLVLQEQSSSSESTMIDRVAETVTSRLAKVVRPKREMGVPSFFTRNVIAESNIRPIAPSGDVFVVGEAVPVDRWIFGQHNKLFTVKASCRETRQAAVRNTYGCCPSKSSSRDCRAGGGTRGFPAWTR